MSAAQVSETADENPEKHECRTCLQEYNTVSFLFQAWSPGWNGMENTIAEDLAKVANVQISESDRHSKYICQTCIAQLKQACQFVCFVQENDRILRLRKFPENKSSFFLNDWPKPIQIDKSISYDNLAIKQEVFSEDENNCDNLEETYILPEYNPQIDIKVEPEEIVASKPCIFNNGTSTLQDDDGKKAKQEVNGGTYYDEEYLEQQVKEEPLSDSEDSELVSSDLSLECLLCSRNFVSVSGLKAHVIAQHSYKTVKRKLGDSSPQKPSKTKYTCAICKRSFLTTTDLMVHETCHNKYVCYGCNEKFDSFEKLTVHRKRCKAFLSKEKVKPKTLDDVIRPLSVEPESNESVPHARNISMKLKSNDSAAIKSEVTNTNSTTEMLICELCKEQFSDSYYMKIHQEVHHAKLSSNLSMKTEPVSMEISALESIFNEDT